MSSWDCSAFRSLELGKCHWPLQAASSGSIIKAPGFAGGYLLDVPTSQFTGLAIADGTVRDRDGHQHQQFFSGGGRHTSILMRLSTLLTPGALQAARSACSRSAHDRTAPRKMISLPLASTELRSCW
jgi:hypothetical protein